MIAIKFKCLSSGSVGNCYILTADNGEQLVLDCGIPIKQFKKENSFNVSDIVGVICTHFHKDHSLSVKDFQKMGIEVWQPYLDENKRQLKKFGCFSVQSFEVPHDCTDCVAYFIKADGHKILYATDFEYLPVSFRKIGLDTLIVECNYCEDMLNKDDAKYKHVLQGHCSLNTYLEIVNDNRDSARNVLACHLSQLGSDKDKILTETKKIANKGVYVDYCRKGLEVDL